MMRNRVTPVYSNRQEMPVRETSQLEPRESPGAMTLEHDLAEKENQPFQTRAAQTAMQFQVNHPPAGTGTLAKAGALAGAVGLATALNNPVIELAGDVKTLTLYDLKGTLINTFVPAQTNGFSFQLTDKHPNGVYHLKVLYKNGKSGVKKLVKLTSTGQIYTLKLKRAYPQVSASYFRATDGDAYSAENKAPHIVGGTAPQKLGVDGAPAYGIHNACEVKFDLFLDGMDFNDLVIDIKRTRENAIDGLIGGKWTKFTGPGGRDPKGTDDDPDNNDEYLFQDSKKPAIYALDAPGFPSLGFPVYDGHKATEVVMTANFKEWVRFTEKFTGNVIDDSCVVNWCVQVYMSKVAGKWTIDKTKSFIKEGTTTIGYP